jgi:hypothetical protein
VNPENFYSMCDDSDATKNLINRNELGLIKQVLEVYFYSNKDKVKKNKDFIENIVKKYYLNKINDNLYEIPKFFNIKKIIIEKATSCRNACLDILEKSDAINIYKNHQIAKSNINLYKQLLNDEEDILKTYHQGFKDILFDACLIKYVHLYALKNKILDLKLKFKTSTLRQLKTIHSCPLMMARVLNLFLILFGISNKDILSMGEQ